MIAPRLAGLAVVVLSGCNGATSTCASGTSCQGSCVSLSSDNLNCGACGHSCPPGQACSDGVCRTTCIQGYDACGSDGGSYCADLAVDFNNCGSCGQACLPGTYCSGAACRMLPATCPTGQTFCDSDSGPGCVNLLSDSANCGSCGAACPTMDSCVGGGCEPSDCPPGFPPCPLQDGGVACTDLSLDVNNCGHCGSSCGPFSSCAAGACACQGGYVQCGSTASPSCINPLTDRGNCGSCGHECVLCESCAAVCTANLSLTEGSQILEDGGFGAVSLVVVDLDGDGIQDVAAIEQISYGNTFVEVFFGDGGGGFPYSLTFASDAGQEGVELASMDLYGDGRKQLAVVTLNDDFAGSGFMILAVDAGALVQLTYQASDPSAGIFPYFYEQVALATGDLNGDGLDDVAVLNADAGTDLFYSQGDGTFIHGAGLPGSFCSYPNQWVAIAIGDLDGDGRADLALGCSDFSVGAFLQLASGGFDPLPPFMLQNSNGLQNYPFKVSIGGELLNVLTYTGFSSFSWTDAGFTSVGNYVGAPYAIASGDFNGDEIQDVITGGSLWLGHVGGFGAPATVPIGYPLAVGDLNGDGRLDVVANSPISSVLTVFTSTCSPGSP
jgi:hypothetical protein